MKIEVWSDLTCPFCYIGKHNFERALKELDYPKMIQVQWRSFELDARAMKEYPGTLYDWLSQRYGRTHEQVIEMNRPIVQQGELLGLKFNLDKVRPTNSFDAHRLMQLASHHGKSNVLAEELYKAFFTNGKNISDHRVLAEAAMACNLPVEDVNDVLTTDKFAMDVREDEFEAERLSIRGVPYFLFDRKRFVSGAQPTSVFLRVLQEGSGAENT